MKTIIAHILAFYILFSAVVPCSIIDNCEEEEEHMEQTSNPKQKDDCNNCSPFSTCASCPGFTINSVYTAIQPVVFIASPAYSVYKSSSSSVFHSTLFQPPRLG